MSEVLEELPISDEKEDKEVSENKKEEIEFVVDKTDSSNEDTNDDKSNAITAATTTNINIDSNSNQSSSHDRSAINVTPENSQPQSVLPPLIATEVPQAQQTNSPLAIDSSGSTNRWKNMTINTSSTLKSNKTSNSSFTGEKFKSKSPSIATSSAAIITNNSENKNQQRAFRKFPSSSSTNSHVIKKSSSNDMSNGKIYANSIDIGITGSKATHTTSPCGSENFKNGTSTTANLTQVSSSDTINAPAETRTKGSGSGISGTTKVETNFNDGKKNNNCTTNNDNSVMRASLALKSYPDLPRDNYVYVKHDTLSWIPAILIEEAANDNNNKSIEDSNTKFDDNVGLSSSSSVPLSKSKTSNNVQQNDSKSSIVRVCVSVDDNDDQSASLAVAVATAAMYRNNNKNNNDVDEKKNNLTTKKYTINTSVTSGNSTRPRKQTNAAAPMAPAIAAPIAAPIATPVWKEIEINLMEYPNRTLPRQCIPSGFEDLTSCIGNDEHKISSNDSPTKARSSSTVFGTGPITAITSAMSYADMVDMEELHEPGILYNLKIRHLTQRPYTRCGDMIVSVNPFQWIKRLYTESNRNFYSKNLVWKTCDTDPRRGLEPHVYEVSALAYKGLAFDDENQSILITGESGSGKTETTKIIMNHIACIQQGPPKSAPTESSVSDSDKNLHSSVQVPSLSPVTATQSTATTGSVALSEGKAAVEGAFGEMQIFSPIVQRILESNPLLEAFGNAKTRRNDNSSRFGKYTQLQFDKGDPTLRQYNLRTKALCVLAGSTCEVYLLEKNRVCTHSESERTYHIFYQLLSTDDTRKELIWKGLLQKSFQDFKYVGPTTTTKIEGQTDEEKYLETYQALSDVGVTGDKYVTLMRAICIVLQLGNVTFDKCPTDDDRSIITSPEEFALLSDLMGVSTDILQKALTERTMITRGETFNVKLKAAASKEAADAFAKEIYSKTFLWLVRAINDATCAELNYTFPDNLDQGSVDHDYGVIGLLDIFGFESFKHNHFEQLCINYANEKLQQKAVNDIFYATKQEYEKEGIPLTEIDFDDNKKVLELLEGRMGLVDILNDECYRPNGTDLLFVQKALQTHALSPCLLPPKNKSEKNKFGIVHYAGVVEYEAVNFVTSNQDSLPSDLIECAKKCTNEIISLHLENNSSSNPLNNSSATASFAAKGRRRSNTSDGTIPIPRIQSMSDTRSAPSTPTRTRGKELPKFLQQLNQKTQTAIATKVTSTAIPMAPLTPSRTGMTRAITSQIRVAPALPSSSNSTKQVGKTSSPVPVNPPTPENITNSLVHKDFVGEAPLTPGRPVADNKESISPKLSGKSHTSVGEHEELNENDSTTPSKRRTKRIIKVVKKMRPAPPKRSNSGLIQTTVWSDYQHQLSLLMDMLGDTKSRYVRCIKPNTRKKPLIMEHSSTVEQLRCSGIVATVCLARAMFPNSLPNGVLRFRYQNAWNQEKYPVSLESINSDSDPCSSKKDVKLKAECEALLECAFQSFSHSKDEGKSPYVVGKTKTYFRKGALEYLESIRVLELDAVATVIQRRVRGILTRKRIAGIRRNTPRIQRWYRAMKEKRKLNNLVRKSRFQKARSMFKTSTPTFIVKGSAFR